MRSFLCLAFALATSCLSFAQERVPLWPEGKTPYALPIDATTGSPSLQLYPTQGKPNHTGAAVVLCPGGGYGGLAKDHEGHQPALWFNEQGVSAFVLHYRLGTQGHHYPTQLADVQRSLRWVRAHAAEHGLDPQRIAVMGFSAGGHLASMAATLYDEKAYSPVDAADELSARPDFAILCYPVISFDPNVTHGGSRKNLLGPERASDEAWATKLSSEKNVTPQTPRTFLFQTDADTAVPAENAIRFYLALRANKVPAEFHSFQSGPHGVGLYRGDPVVGVWSELLTKWLRSNSFFAPAQPRASVSGEISLDGKPISWGSVTFHPVDTRLPSTTIRIRNGKFTAKGEEGPATGPARVTVEGSIWEATGATQDRSVRLESLAPHLKDPVLANIASENPPFRWDFVSR